MPRYHFDLIDGVTIADQGGQIVADDIMAADVADRLAKELLRRRPELGGRRYSILVTNEDGEEIHRAELDQSDRSGIGAGAALS
jgi:hypothetical protein